MWNQVIAGGRQATPVLIPLFPRTLGLIRESELTARHVEIEPPIVVLLTMWRAGVPITKLNGKSRQTIVQPSSQITVVNRKGSELW